MAAIRANLARRYGQLRNSGLELIATARVARRPVAVVHGNCQAEPTRRMLRPALAESYSLIRVPPVHLATADAAARLKCIIPRVRLLITQPVRNGYRDLDLGTASFRAVLPPTARTVSVPSIFFRGYHPYLVYVNATGFERHRTSIGEYHDLRTIEAARRRLIGSDGVRWIEELPAAHLYMQSVWDESAAELRRRERSLDVKLADVIVDGTHPMFTLNHPPAYLLVEQCRQVLSCLERDPDLVATPRIEPFADLIIPADSVGPSTRQSASTAGARDWLVYGKPIPETEVISRNLVHYAQHPDILAAAVEQHAPVLSDLFETVPGPRG